MSVVSTLAGWRPGASLLAVALIWLGTGCGSSQPSEDAATDPSTQAAAASSGARPAPDAPPRRVPRRLREGFAVFRTQPERLSTRARDALLTSTPGTSRSLAQRLPGTPWPIWALPGRDTVCLLSQERQDGAISSSCTDIRRALTNGIFVATLTDSAGPAQPGTRIATGMVPDRTRKVRVRTIGHPSTTVPASHNVFTLRDTITEPPETVTPIR